MFIWIPSFKLLLQGRSRRQVIIMSFYCPSLGILRYFCLAFSIAHLIIFCLGSIKLWWPITLISGLEISLFVFICMQMETLKSNLLHISVSRENRVIKVFSKFSRSLKKRALREVWEKMCVCPLLSQKRSYSLEFKKIHWQRPASSCCVKLAKWLVLILSLMIVEKMCFGW